MIHITVAITNANYKCINMMKKFFNNAFNNDYFYIFHITAGNCNLILREIDTILCDSFIQLSSCFLWSQHALIDIWCNNHQHTKLSTDLVPNCKS